MTLTTEGIGEDLARDEADRDALARDKDAAELCGDEEHVQLRERRVLEHGDDGRLVVDAHGARRQPLLLVLAVLRAEAREVAPLHRPQQLLAARVHHREHKHAAQLGVLQQLPDVSQARPLWNCIRERG